MKNISMSSPIIIGGTGGSGTRVVQDILSRAGIFMGERLNHAGDAMDFEPFLDETINPLLAHTQMLNYSVADLPKSFAEERLRSLETIAKLFAGDRPQAAIGWGWKNPRSIYILPLIHTLFPDLRFVHVVRDGRDMAFSENQNQLRKHYAALFVHERDKDIPAASIELWARVNKEIASWGEVNLAANYVRVRFEDLCEYPEDTTRYILQATGIEVKNIDAIAKAVERPVSIGRYKQATPEMLEQITKIGAGTLRLFGYI